MPAFHRVRCHFMFVVMYASVSVTAGLDRRVQGSIPSFASLGARQNGRGHIQGHFLAYVPATLPETHEFASRTGLICSRAPRDLVSVGVGLQKARSCPRLVSLRSVSEQGDSDGCTALEEKIMYKYIEAFPSYTMEADRELLQTRARESIERARAEFEQGLDVDGATELSGEGLSASDRADKFFTEDSVRRAATDYVWKREMRRISGQDQQTTQTTRFVAQGLTFVLFAPVWYYFFTNIPTREFREVFLYSANIVREAMGIAPF